MTLTEVPKSRMKGSTSSDSALGAFGTCEVVFEFLLWLVGRYIFDVVEKFGAKGTISETLTKESVVPCSRFFSKFVRSMPPFDRGCDCSGGGAVVRSLSCLFMIVRDHIYLIFLEEKKDRSFWILSRIPFPCHHRGGTSLNNQHPEPDTVLLARTIDRVCASLIRQR